MKADRPLGCETGPSPARRRRSVEHFVSQGRTTALSVSVGPSRPSDPVVSVVVLNWNGGAFVAAAVDSVAGRDDVECIVVDNASTDGSGERLLERADVDVHATCPENVGYARGMNIGCWLARSPLVLLMNCDATAPPGYLDVLIAAAQRHPGATMLGGPSYRPAEPSTASVTPDVAAERVLDAGPMELTLTVRVSDLADVDAERAVMKVTGSCTAVRLPLDPAIGDLTDGLPFDESFVTYGEDIDFACRVWRAGGETVYVPALWSWHERSFASGRRVWEKRSTLRRNVLSARYRNVLRHVPGWRKPLALVLVGAGDLLLVGYCLFRGDLSILGDAPRAAVRGLTLGMADRRRLAAASASSVRRMPELPLHARRRRAT